MRFEEVSDDLRSAPRRSMTRHDPLLQTLMAGKTVKIADSDMKSTSTLYKEVRAMGKVLHVRSFDTFKVLWVEDTDGTEPTSASTEGTEIPVENLSESAVEATS